MSLVGEGGTRADAVRVPALSADVSPADVSSADVSAVDVSSAQVAEAQVPEAHVPTARVSASGAPGPAGSGGAGLRVSAAGVVRRLWREMVGFGLVGSVGVTCDFATFNLVLQVFHRPHVVASLAGTGLGTVVGYLGNKFWVFRRRQQRQSTAELLLFVLVSLVGMGITAVCVDLNEQVLGNHSVLSANIAQFIFGQGLGTVFRFWACHRWVFPEGGAVPEPATAPGSGSGSVPGSVPAADPADTFL